MDLKFVTIVLFPFSFLDSNLDKQLQYPKKNIYIYILLYTAHRDFTTIELVPSFFPVLPGQQYRIPDGITPTPCPSWRADDGGDFLSPAGRLVVIGPKPIFEAGDKLLVLIPERIQSKISGKT